MSAQYGTWIRSRKVLVFLAAGVSDLVLAGVLSTQSPWFGLLALAGLFPLAIAAILLRVQWLFSDEGGGYQGKVHDLIVSSVRRPGETLDIGCGSGRLVIKLAKVHPLATLTGMDYWGEAWEYSQKQCEANAEAEGVKATFVQGSASQLPFAEASFDIVVSCLTFHEVRDVADRLVCLTEALRVLKPGGQFALLDLFDQVESFGERSRVLAALEAGGGILELNTRVADLVPLPFPLSGPQSLRDAVLLVGTKRS